MCHGYSLTRALSRPLYRLSFGKSELIKAVTMALEKDFTHSSKSSKAAGEYHLCLSKMYQALPADPTHANLVMADHLLKKGVQVCDL